MTRKTEDILAELEKEKNRRENLTKEELSERYAKLKKAGFESENDSISEFIYDISESKQIEYHYELICEDFDRKENIDMDLYFDRHDIKGIDYLFEKLADEKYKKYTAKTAYLLAICLELMKHRDFYKNMCGRLLPHLEEISRHKNAEDRRKAVIAIGWVGTENNISLLCSHMINDTDSLCRAWASASLMQMSFHRVKSNVICKEAFRDLKAAIENEKDLFALGNMITAAGALWNKKFISQTAVENRDEEKIMKAKKSAVNFLAKL